MQRAEQSPPLHYPMGEIVRCMRTSARMLMLADKHDPKLNKCNCRQGELLVAAADDLEAQTRR
jgi:hypothetical protein